MLAYHNDRKIKAEYQRRVDAHREADQIIRGVYWAENRGCAVGCTIHSDEHNRYETELGIPTAIAHLEDYIFEALPIDDARLFPGQFLDAIPVGADLSNIPGLFIIATLQTVRQYAFDDGKAVIDACITLWERQLRGDHPSDSAWASAAAARPVASAAAAARYAAWSATRSAAEAATEAAAIIEQRDLLLNLLRNAPIPQ